jgi:hypothetical protein
MGEMADLIEDAWAFDPEDPIGYAEYLHEPQVSKWNKCKCGKWIQKPHKVCGDCTMKEVMTDWDHERSSVEIKVKL